jgi:virginiamycin B lyase
MGGVINRTAAVLLAGSLLFGGCSSSPSAGEPSEADSSTMASSVPPPTDPGTGAPTSETLPPLLAEPVFDEWQVPAGSRPHDAAPTLTADGRVWYAGQGSGEAGVLDPTSGDVERVALGAGSAPHGVIVGDDGTAWLTDGGLNAVVAVDPDTFEVTTYQLPTSEDANLNTATFDGAGILWFTGQSGIYGRLDPASGDMEVFDAPRGRGPYGIATTPAGDVWFASLAGSYIARITDHEGTLEVVDTPTPGGGARRVWSDSRGRLWVTEWNAGKLAMYDPAAATWLEWPLPGDDPQPYAVFVDDADLVWVTDFGGDALVRFDPVSEEFTVFAWPTPGAQVRQLLGRPGEVWGTGSAIDTVIVLRTR